MGGREERKEREMKNNVQILKGQSHEGWVNEVVGGEQG